MIKIYSDGAYSSSRDRGGWAFVVTENDERIHSEFGDIYTTTNNRMEILASLKAIQWCKENNIKEFDIYTDSMYVIGTFTKNWKRKKNIDLWLKADELIQGVTINWQHIKGHSGDRWNEMCDMLAVHAYNILEE